MKKFILLLISLCLLLSSCVTDVTPGTMSSEETETTAPTPGEIYGTDTAVYKRFGNFTDAKSRILIANVDTLYYYSKADGEGYVFCFDPLCDHRSSYCISLKFAQAGMSYGMEIFTYCDYDNRFYALRGDKLYSLNFDASDLKLEYAFGDTWDISQFLYDFFALRYLQIYGDCAYMIYQDEENGKYNLRRYDIKTGKMTNLTDGTDLNIYDYFVYNNSIYFVKWSDPDGMLYIADMNMKNISETGKNGMDTINSIIDGSTVYSFAYNYEYDEQGASFIETSMGISSYNLESGETDIIYESDKKISLLAATDKYIYFTQNEPAIYGVHTDDYGSRNISNPTGGKIYRIKKDGSDLTAVLDNMEYTADDIRFDGNTVIISGNYYYTVNGSAEDSSSTFKAALDENGCFADIEEIDFIK